MAVESPNRLTKRAIGALENLDNVLEVSSVSLSEIAIKNTRGKLNISGEQTRTALHDMAIRTLPYTAAHAFRLFDLPLHHKDPFDRQIIAQAIAEGIPVLSSDEHFPLYKGLKVIWK